MRNSEKNANKVALRKASRRIGAVIVVAIDANTTVALTNAKEAYKPNKGTAREENVRVGKKGGGGTPCDPPTKPKYANNAGL